MEEIPVISYESFEKNFWYLQLLLDFQKNYESVGRKHYSATSNITRNFSPKKKLAKKWN